MPEARQVVIKNRRAEARLPDWTGEGVALVTHLFESGFLTQVEERLRIVRSGYVGIDAVLQLLFYFACGAKMGLRKFDGRVAGFRRQLAALGGRVSLPTQSSMSRLLGDATLESVREVGRWMLREGAGVTSLLSHPCMVTLDAIGRAWHVFDYDPTKTALRKRALPEAEDLPPAQRRAEGFAAPGHAGRKRGEWQISRSALQHAGASVWLDARVASGNGETRAQLGSAIEAVVEVCHELKHPLDRAVMRLDGEFGNVPSLTALREGGVCGITRLNRLALLDQPEIRQRMATHPWHFVPDSRSGPQRSAMDLGMVTVRPGERTTLRDDGSAYEPIDVRVVVSRYQREEKANHGRVIGGWQYELFAGLDLDAEGWPAPDVVASYYGRGGQENRFAQEDHELGLDRIFSYTLAGQELACIVGLLMWNLRVVHGFLLNPLPEERTPALPRAMEVDPRPVPEGFVEEVDVSEEPEPTGHVAEPVQDPRIGLARLLSEVDFDRLMCRLPDWKIERDLGALRCPNQQAVELGTVCKNISAKTHMLVFRGSKRICRPCPLRGSCLVSANVDKPKTVALNVPKAAGDEIARQLTEVQHLRRLERSDAAHARALPSGRPRPTPAGTHLAVHPPHGEQNPGPWQNSGAQFLPAAARGAFRAVCRDIVVRVTVISPPAESPHPYLVTTPAKRQHRRLTWTERNARYALPAAAELRVVFEGGDQLGTALRLGTHPPRVHA